MKILFVTPYFYPKIGGLENYVYNIAKGLKNKYKWDVVIVTSNHKSKKDIKEKVDGLTVYRLAPLFKVSNTPINPFWYFKMKKIFNKEKPNIINAHTPVPFIAEVSALASGSTPFILTYHALSLYKQGFTPLNMVIWVYRLIEKYLFHKSKKIIVVSEYIKEKFPSYLNHKMIVINNFIAKQEMSKVISDSKKENIVLFAGNLDKTHNWKGLDSLLVSIKIFVKLYNEKIKLVIIGEGNWKQNYKSIAKDLHIEKFVSFEGLKTGNEKRKYFKEAKIAVIYPKTSNDALPTFLLESWGYSLPIIGSRIMPLSKIIKDNSTGMLIEPNSPRKLTNAIYELLTDNQLRKRISRNGFNTVKSLYLFNDQLTKFHTLMKTI